MNNFYTNEAPNVQSTLNILDAEWISHVPIKGTVTGQIPLFDDHRIHWLNNRISLDGLNVLELGSFEGGHTYMLSRYGAYVTAVEANSLSFLKSIIAKNLLGFEAINLFGDFLAYLESCENFDLIVASGVLYHMINPVELLVKISSKSSRFFIWTHYFDQDFSHWNPEIAQRIKDKFDTNSNLISYAGLNYKVITQYYLESLQLKEFCGGPTDKSSWMYRDDILDCIDKLGFSVEIVMESRDHKHGPSFAIYCERKIT